MKIIKVRFCKQCPYRRRTNYGDAYGYCELFLEFIKNQYGIADFCKLEDAGKGEEK